MRVLREEGGSLRSSFLAPAFHTLGSRKLPSDSDPLNAGRIDADDWVQNALQLSSFHTETRDWAGARLCLEAARALLEARRAQAGEQQRDGQQQQDEQQQEQDEQRQGEKPARASDRDAASAGGVDQRAAPATAASASAGDTTAAAAAEEVAAAARRAAREELLALLAPDVAANACLAWAKLLLARLAVSHAAALADCDDGSGGGGGGREAAAGAAGAAGASATQSPFSALPGVPAREALPEARAAAALVRDYAGARALANAALPLLR